MTEVVEEPEEKAGKKAGERAGGLRVGMELEVVFREAGEFVVPVFRARR